MNMVTWIAALLCLCVSCGCSNFPDRDKYGLSVPEAVSLAYDRAQSELERGGEKDEFIHERIAHVFSKFPDSEVANTLARLNAEKVASLRIFFTPIDFIEGRGNLAGQRYELTLKVIDSVPVPPVWPIERATAVAWKQPGRRFDWKVE